MICQIADSAFPAGGFAHSAGLEAAWQHGRIQASEDLERQLRTQLLQISKAAVPFVVAAFCEPDRLGEFDAICDAFLSNHVARRASAAQGRAFILAASKAFDHIKLAAICQEVRLKRMAGHLATVFGVSAAAIGLSQIETARLFVFLSLRGLISAAVRLGVSGPLEGQQMQWRLSDFGESLLERAMSRPIDLAVHTAPVLELLQGTQDRLYSRLFQS